MSIYTAVRSAYKSVVPQPTRRAIYRITPSSLMRLRVSFLAWLQRGATHDQMYDEHYYHETVERFMQRSCEPIAESIVTRFHPRSVIDVGCGTGLLLGALCAYKIGSPPKKLLI